VAESLVTGRKRSTTSTPWTELSWIAPLPNTNRATCPVRIRTGRESVKALAMPVSALVAPGPLVAQQTASERVTRA
jgi:hypothetical protein